MPEKASNSAPARDQGEVPVVEQTQDDEPPKEDLFAWLQTLGAFVLNLNTW